MSVGNVQFESCQRGSGHTLTSLKGAAIAIGLGAGVLLWAPDARAQFRKIGEMELRLAGVVAAPESTDGVVPKNTDTGLRIQVRVGGIDLGPADLSRFLGDGFRVQGEVSGPGLVRPVSLPRAIPGATPSADPLLLAIPGLPVAGDYSISNLRIVSPGHADLEVTPSTVTLKVIEQILVTSVKTRPLSLDEIREKGIVLDKDDYIGFEFTLGAAIESRAVEFKFPAVFDRAGVSIPIPDRPEVSALSRSSDALSVQSSLSGAGAAFQAVLLTPDESSGGGGPELTLENGQPVRIPSLLVIPGNVGFLKQQFSAQLFVANGAPPGSRLRIKEVSGTIHLPFASDGELALTLAETVRGPQGSTRAVRHVGPDEISDTDDDIDELGPAEQGMTEFLLQGEKEGFHTLNFDISALLEGLPVGSVRVSGKASGGLVVRNPFFNMTFALPSVVRQNEDFTVFATLNNIGQGAGNAVRIQLDASRLSGALPLDGTERTVDTIPPGGSAVVKFRFKSQKTGSVYATYLRFDADSAGASGQVNFTLGVGERGIALSPDTLVLPSSADLLPADLQSAAMRVLGQAWSIARTNRFALPRGVLPIAQDAVQRKLLMFAEAGLRVQLGQEPARAARDLIGDFYGSSEGVLDQGFDQLLRTTDAGREFAKALANTLAASVDAEGGAVSYERGYARVLASGQDFASFAVAGAQPSLQDFQGRALGPVSSTQETGVPAFGIPGGVALSWDGSAGASLGVVNNFGGGGLRLLLDQQGDFAMTVPNGDGTFLRATGHAQAAARVIATIQAPSQVRIEEDRDGDGSYETPGSVTTEILAAEGPGLETATVVGPDLYAGASDLGVHAAFLFDRIVAESAGPANFYISRNVVLGARRQLSGRLVFGRLAVPEGPYVEKVVSVSGISDLRGISGADGSVPLESLALGVGGRVSGRVVDGNGAAVSGGQVFYSNSDTTPPACQVSRSLGTLAIPVDSQGQFEIDYVRRNPCGRPFELSYQDAVTGEVRKTNALVRLPGESLIVDIALIGRGSVSGVVRDFTGNPVPGASVQATSATDPYRFAQSTADAQGRYVISGLTVGQVAVLAVRGNALGRNSGRILRAGTTAAVDVILDGGSVHIAGRFVQAVDGAAVPIRGGVVSYALLGPDGGPAGYARTDDDGHFELPGMPAGSYRIDGAGYGPAGPAAKTVTGLAGLNAHITDILLLHEPRPVLGGGTDAESALVQGTVLSASGLPAADVVVARDTSGLLIDSAVTTGPDGTFAIRVTGSTISAVTRDRKRRGSVAFTADPLTRTATGVVIRLSGLATAEFTVVNGSGQPIAGQDVFILKDPTTVGACRNPCGCTSYASGGDGKIRITDQPLGGIDVQAVRLTNGFTEVARSSISLVRDGQVAFGTIRLLGPGIVSGTVTSPAGAVIQGGEVTLTSQVFKNDGVLVCGLQAKVSHRATINPETGTFRFTGVHTGGVSVLATNPFAPTPRAASGVLTQGGQEVHFDLQFVNTTSGKLSGIVFLPDGLTPAGAGVEVSIQGPAGDLSRGTAEDGSYEFPSILPQGSYTIVVRDPVTGAVGREGVSLPAGSDHRHDLRLKGLGSLKVKVVNSVGVPSTESFVRARETDYPFGVFEAAIEPNGLGEVVFPRVHEGPVSVEVSDPLRGGGRGSTVIPKPGAEVAITIALGTTGTVRGRFLMPDGSTPIPFGSIRLLSNGRVIGQSTAAGSGDVGAFSFPYVPAGPIRIEAEDPLTLRSGFATGSLTEEGEELVLDVLAQGLGTVTGRVTSRRDGLEPQPEAGAHVDLVSGSYRVATVTDSTGNYLVEGIPEGRVSVTAALASGFLSGTAAALLSGDGSTVVLDVALRDSGEVFGQVLNADGTPFDGFASVKVVVGGVGGATQSVTTDGSAFHFLRVPAGQGDISIDVIGDIDRGKATVTISPGRNDIEVTLNGTGSVEGLALSATGANVAGRVTLSGAGPFPWSETVYTSGDGKFRLTKVLAGPVRGSLEATEGVAKLYGQGTGTIPFGDVGRFNIVLQPSGTITGRVVRSGGIPAGYGVEISAEAAGGVRFLADSDASGQFALRGLPFGVYKVRARDLLSDALAIVNGLRIEEAGASVPTGDLQLSLIGLRGKVRNSDGAPVSGASVTVSGRSPVLTGADGTYVVTGLPPTNYVVTVQDPITGYVTPARSVTMIDGFESIADFTLPDIAYIAGQVTRSSGGAVPGIIVSTAGRTRTTDAQGRFDLGAFSLGQYSILADDPASEDQTTLVASLSMPGEHFEANLRLTGLGSVQVTVRTASGALAPNVSVSVRNALAGSNRSGTTNAQGVAMITSVVAGSITITASDPATHGTGQSSAVVLEGQQTLVDISLEPVGQIVGVVTRATGGSAAGVQVTLLSTPSVSVLTGPAGAYVFEGVRLGSYTIDALNLLNGDRGRSTATLGFGGAIATSDMTMNGVGTLRVRVNSAAGSAIPGATVDAALSGPFARGYRATTDGSGDATFQNVLAGSLSLSASALGLTGAGNAFVVADETVTATVALQADASVVGVVRWPNADPVPSAVVNLYTGQTTTGADGAFALSGLPPAGAYSLQVRKGGRLRYQAAAPLAAGPQTINPVLVGEGVVTGLVTKDGVAATGATVTLTQNGTYGGSYSAVTGPDGHYSIAGPVIGAYAITAVRGGDRAEATGVVLSHGATSTSDLALVSSAVTLPVTLFDGNGTSHVVRNTGPTNRTWSTLSGSEVMTLKVEKDGVVQSFVNALGAIAAREDADREVVIRGSLHGLDVTRKVAVPLHGYLQRTIESLSNPTGLPIRVSVRLEAEAPPTFTAPLNLTRTSSGDAVLDASDVWLVLDDGVSLNGWDSNTYEYSTGLVFSGGPQAPRPPTAATFNPATRSLVVRYDDVDIPEGGTVSFLHAQALLGDEPGAVAAAVRLQSLPPELLEGLSVDEAASIVNFAVPADLVSAVPDLPPNDGVVVVEKPRSFDGSRLPDGTVTLTFKSRSAFFPRKHAFAQSAYTSVADRPYLRVQVASTTEAQVMVPRGPFDVELAYAPQASSASPLIYSFAGDFPAEGRRDLSRTPSAIAFSSGAAASTALLFDGDYANEGGPTATNGFAEVTWPFDATIDEVRLYGMHRLSGPLQSRVQVFDALGAVVFTTDVNHGPAPRNAVVSVPNATGRRVRVTPLAGGLPSYAEIQIFGVGDVGLTHRADFTPFNLLDTGNFRGRVLRSDGSPIAGASVLLRAAGSTAQVSHTTGSDGTFVFSALRPGAYDITVGHPLGSLTTTSSVSLVAATEEVRDLAFPELGGLAGTLSTAAGFPTNGSVTLTASGFSRPLSVFASQGGAFTFIDVPPGAYTLTATEDRSHSVLTIPVVVGAGGPINQPVGFPPVGSVAVTALLAGQPLPSAQVTIKAVSRGPSGAQSSGTTNISGQATIANIPGPTFTVRVVYPGLSSSFSEATATLSTEAQVVPVTVNVPGAGRVTGKVVSRTGTAITPPVTHVVVVDDGALDLTQTVLQPAYDFLVPAEKSLSVLSSILCNCPSAFWASTLTAATVPAHGVNVVRDSVLPLGVIAPDSRQYYTFHAIAGQVATLNTGNMADGATAAAPSTAATVFGPSGMFIAHTAPRSGASGGATVAFTPALDGDYTVEVRGGTATASGAYLVGRGYELPMAIAQPTSIFGFALRQNGTRYSEVTQVRLSVGGVAVGLTPTDASGSYSFLITEGGDYVLEALSSSQVVLRALSGSLATGAQLHHDIIQATPALLGAVRASDGVTPLPGVVVVAGGKQAVTDLSGAYRLDNLTPGLQNVSFTFQGLADTVQVNIATGGDTGLDHTQAFAWPHRILVQDTLGTPIPGSSVEVCAPYAAVPVCEAPRFADPFGLVSFLGLPAGDGYNTITVTTPDGGVLSTDYYWSVYFEDTLAITFPAVGWVQGTVTLPSGQAAAGVSVQATDETGSLLGSTATAADGRYSIGRVGGHDVTVKASMAPGLIHAEGTAAVGVGADVTLDLVLPVASLNVTVVDLSGQPAEGQQVDVALAGARMVTGTTDAAGHVVFDAIPAGPARVIATALQAGAETEVASGQAANIVLHQDSHHLPEQIGAFQICSGGDLRVDGDCSEGDVRVATTTFRSSTDYDPGTPSEPPVSLFRSSASAGGTTQTGLLTWALEQGVYVRQEVYVANSGAFSRSLAVFTNITDRPVSIVATTFGSSGGCFNPSYGPPGAPEYRSVECNGPYGIAFGSGAEVNDDDGRFDLRRTLTLEPHSSQGIMVFTTTDPTLLPSLLDLSAEGALDDLPSAKRSIITNFEVPVVISVSVTGTALSSTGVPLAGASVTLVQGGQVVAQTFAGPDGAFVVSGGVRAGAFDLAIFRGDDAGTWTVAALLPGPIDLGPVQTLPPLDRGSAWLVVSDLTGASVEGLNVSAEPTAFGGLYPAVQASTDANGVAVISGLFPGLNRLETSLGVAYVRVVAGGEASVRLQRGAGLANLSGTVTLDGSPVKGAVVVATGADPLTGAETVVARATTDALGRYVLTGLPDGADAYLYAWDPDQNRHASNYAYVAPGTIDGTGPEIQLADDTSVGSVRIRAIKDQDGTPAAGHMALVSFSTFPFTAEVTLDEKGEAVIANIPGFEVHATVTGSAGFGHEFTYGEPGVEILLAVPVGNRVALPTSLGGFRVSGTRLDSPLPNGSEPLNFTAYASLGPAFEPSGYIGSATPTLDGRELVSVHHSPFQGDPDLSLRLTRRVFVPQDGSFARVVSILENVGTETRNAGYTVSTFSNEIGVGPDGYAVSAILSETLGDGVVRTDDQAYLLTSDQPSAATIGVALWGASGLEPSTAFDSAETNLYSRNIEVRWADVGLAPGQKVAFMTFAVSDRGAGAGTVAGRLLALMTLTNPLALQGLSLADRQLIVNWNLQ